jgi:hypothetical protein
MHLAYSAGAAVLLSTAAAAQVMPSPIGPPLARIGGPSYGPAYPPRRVATPDAPKHDVATAPVPNLQDSVQKPPSANKRPSSDLRKNTIEPPPGRVKATTPTTTRSDRIRSTPSRTRMPVARSPRDLASTRRPTTRQARRPR